MPAIPSSYSALPGVMECAKAVAEVDGILFTSPGRFRPCTVPHRPRVKETRRGLEVEVYSRGQTQCIEVELISMSKAGAVLTAIRDLLDQMPEPSTDVQVQSREEATMSTAAIAPFFAGSPHTILKGCEAFIRFLGQQAGVEKIVAGKTSYWKAAAPSRPPGFKAKKVGVEVTWYGDDGLQILHVFPNKHIKPERLCRLLQKAWAKEQERGGVGESSKSPVIIPPAIQQQMDRGRTGAVLPSGNGHQTGKPTSRIFRLTAQRAETYAYLRSFNPGAVDSFELERVTGLLGEKFPGQGINRYGALVASGVIEAIERVDTNRMAKRFRVLIGEVIIVNRVVASPSKVSSKPSPPVQTMPKPPETKATIVSKADPISSEAGGEMKDHIRFFKGMEEKKRRLEEQISGLSDQLKALEVEGEHHRRALKKMHLEVVIKKGEILFRPV